MNVSRKDFLRACAVTTVALTVGPPLLHLESSLRVIGAFLGRRIDCGIGIEPQNLNYPFDAIAVPGSAIVRMADGTDVPDEREKIRLEAAAIAYLNKFAPKIILLNGEKNLMKTD